MKSEGATQRRPYRMVARAKTAAATGERILDAAVEVFWELPGEHLSLEEVAERAGVSVQTVIRRFGGRDELLAAAAEREGERVRRQRDEASVDDARGAVRVLIDHYEATGDRVIKMLAEEERVLGLREIADRGRALHRQWCERVFASALAGRTGIERRRRLAQARRPMRRLHLEASPPRRWHQPPTNGARLGRAPRTTAGGTLMARVLAYTSPARGHLFPVTPILDELQRRGHEVALLTLASEVEMMRSRGFDAAPIDPAIEAIQHDDFKARTPTGGLKRAVRVFGRRAAHDARDLSQAVDDVRPDALLIDIHAWGARTVAELWGGPWASWCPHPLPVPSRDAPPFGPGLPPARGPAGRLRDRTLSPFLTRVLDRPMRSGLNQVRAELGASPVESVEALVSSIPLLLYLTAEPFEYPRSDWPANVHLVGACDWDPPADPPEWLDEIAEPIVLVTTSSEFQDDSALVRCALEALAGEGVHVVATLPSGNPAAFDASPSSHVLPFIPHAPILDRAVCAITHGGMGATQKALARGVPVCVVPFGRDQLEVARRAEVAGAGTRLAPRRLAPGRLRAAVKEAMNLGPGARRVADGYRAAGGAVAAADALDELLGSRLIPPVRA